MNKVKASQQIDKHLLPPVAGYSTSRPTLCIGLDVAWFGGSQNNKSSQYDFLAAALVSPKSSKAIVQHRRVRLENRDPEAQLTCEAVKELVKQFDKSFDRLVFAVDAPLQSAERKLLVRESKPPKRSVVRRACDGYLSCKRKSIDNAVGGAKGWHPNIQPGAPLAPRIEFLIDGLPDDFVLWTPESAAEPKLMIECFPAEAIWAARRMNWFPSTMKASTAKSYKSKKGKSLTKNQVTKIVTTILKPFANVCSMILWNNIVEQVLSNILGDDQWKRNDKYPGGKMLDDVVDSMICLATAISYANRNAHVWHDKNHPTDGHIVGPGNMLTIAEGNTN